MFSIKIARCISQINLNNRAYEGVFRERFSGFLTEETPHCKIYARIIDDFKVADYNRRTPVVKKGNNTYLFKWYYFSGRFDERSGVVRVDLNNKPHILSALLRMIYAIKIIKAGGIFMHAASFVKDDKAYIFSGKSGAGKSTLARMAMEADPTVEVLSDEISCITVENGRVYAYSTPFWGDTKVKGRYIKAPVKTIFFINKAKRNSTVRISSSEIIQNMLMNLLFASIDRENSLMGLSTINQIIGKTDCKILNFKKDASFLGCI